VLLITGCRITPIAFTAIPQDKSCSDACCVNLSGGLNKAYDSIPRDALWRVLSAYGVDPKIIELLADLHTGTQAAVKLAGEMAAGLTSVVVCGRVVSLPLCCSTYLTVWSDCHWLKCLMAVVCGWLSEQRARFNLGT